MTQADIVYLDLIESLLNHGKRVVTRNHPVRRLILQPSLLFDETPLVTLKKTAWKKAIREMEWFLSGESKCPDELLDWWKEQLCLFRQSDDKGVGYWSGYHYLRGYGEQLRHSASVVGQFDQIRLLIAGLCNHPFSRRHVISTWNSGDMTAIVLTNRNLNTPATCHGTIVQFFVEDGLLSMAHYQRSADILLGVPHNWIQWWAFLLWLAVQVDLKPGRIQWTFGDLHLYDAEDHMAAARAIKEAYTNRMYSPTLRYTGQKGDEFKAFQFEMDGEIPEPVFKGKLRIF